MGRYDNPPKVKNGKIDKQEAKPEAEAKKTAGDPPSDVKQDGQIKKPDGGPTPGAEGPMWGEVAKRHENERKDMIARHKTEADSMISRHHEEYAKTAKRHEKELAEVAPDKDEATAEKEIPGPDKNLGKPEHIDHGKGTEP